MSFDFKIVNGNLSISNTGQVEIVEKEAKLVQDLLKIILSQKGFNKRHPWYGTNIINGGVGNSFDFQFTSSFLQSQVKSAIEILISLQKQQEKSQYVSPEESIAAIKNVSVKERFNDPRYLDIYISVINKLFRNTETSVSISNL
jgi:hypothetical protein